MFPRQIKKDRPTKVSIYLNDVLIALQDSTKKSHNSFSARIGGIVNQYKIIMDATHLPDFSDDELEIIGNAFAGSTINGILVKYMVESVEEFMQDIVVDEITKNRIIDKIKNLDVSQRIKLLDQIFYPTLK